MLVLIIKNIISSLMILIKSGKSSIKLNIIIIETKEQLTA